MILKPYYLVLFTALILMSCKEAIRIEEIKGSYLNNNPIIIQIKVKTNQETNAFIEYWKDGREDTSSTSISRGLMTHDFILTHLLSEQVYSYQVTIQRGKTSETSEIYSFSTKSLPDYIPSFTLVAGDETVFDGHIMVRKMTDPGAQIILNNKGEVVWYQVSDSAVFRPFYITSDTSYLALKDTDEMIEMSIYGDSLFHLKKGIAGFDKDLHHEIFKNDKKQIIALTKETKQFDFTELGGPKADTVVGDGILILDSLGNKVWSWSIFNTTDLEVKEELFKTRKDWSHANALSYDRDGNFLMSFRNFNQVWKIDATDGHVIWKLGDDGDFELNEQDYFVGQHAVHINPRGETMIFDNTVEEINSSRALGFSIDEDQMSAKVTLAVNLPDSLYSFKQGNVSFIDHDKLLFCSSMSKKIAITNLDGEILWQVNSDQSFYRAEYMANNH